MAITEHRYPRGSVRKGMSERLRRGNEIHEVHVITTRDEGDYTIATLVKTIKKGKK